VAARGGQFLVEQDHHEAVAPTDVLLQNRDRRIPGQLVTFSHHVTDFVPEPILVAASPEKTRPPNRISQRPLTIIRLIAGREIIGPGSKILVVTTHTSADRPDLHPLRDLEPLRPSGA
jgi:hypothetical protein